MNQYNFKNNNNKFQINQNNNNNYKLNNKKKQLIIKIIQINKLKYFKVFLNQYFLDQINYKYNQVLIIKSGIKNYYLVVYRII